MLETLQLYLIWAIIGSCVGSFLLLLLHRNKLLETSVTKWLAVVTSIIAVAALVTRIIAVGRLPFTTGLDFGFWLCALMLIISAVITIKQKVPVVGFLIYPIAVGLAIWMLSLIHI